MNEIGSTKRYIIQTFQSQHCVKDQNCNNQNKKTIRLPLIFLIAGWNLQTIILSALIRLKLAENSEKQ